MVSLLVGCIFISEEELAARLADDGETGPEDCGEADTGAGCPDEEGPSELRHDGRGDYGASVVLLEGGGVGTGAPSEGAVWIDGVELDGPASCSGGDAAGWSVAAVPDADGDGHGELLTGAPELLGGGSCTGRAWYVPSTRVVDAEGRLDHLVVLDVGEAGSGFGHALAAADLDGDGAADAAVGAPVAGSVYLFADEALAASDAPGAAGTWEAPGAGFAVASAGDVDGDGADELLVVADAGLSVLAGMAADVRATVAGVGGCGPGCAAGLGDVDGDGHDDVAVADSSNIYVIPGGALDGDVDAISAASLLIWAGGVIALAGAGDVAGDAERDLLVSEVSGVWIVCALDAGGLDLADATCGSLSSDAEGFGAAVAGGVDVGLGGHGADVAVGAPGESAVLLFAGAR